MLAIVHSVPVSPQAGRGDHGGVSGGCSVVALASIVALSGCNAPLTRKSSINPAFLLPQTDGSFGKHEASTGKIETHLLESKNGTFAPSSVAIAARASASSARRRDVHARDRRSLARRADAVEARALELRQHSATAPRPQRILLLIGSLRP